MALALAEKQYSSALLSVDSLIDTPSFTNFYDQLLDVVSKNLWDESVYDDSVAALTGGASTAKYQADTRNAYALVMDKTKKHQVHKVLRRIPRNDSRAVFAKLRVFFRPNDEGGRQTAQDSFYHATMANTNTNIIEWAELVNERADVLRDTGESVSKSTQKTRLLAGLLLEFDNIKLACESMTDASGLPADIDSIETRLTNYARSRNLLDLTKGGPRHQNKTYVADASPNNKRDEPCRNWAANKCRYGKRCKYNHDGPGGPYNPQNKESRAAAHIARTSDNAQASDPTIWCNYCALQPVARNCQPSSHRYASCPIVKFDASAEGQRGKAYLALGETPSHTYHAGASNDPSNAIQTDWAGYSSQFASDGTDTDGATVGVLSLFLALLFSSGKWAVGMLATTLRLILLATTSAFGIFLILSLVLQFYQVYGANCDCRPPPSVAKIQETTFFSSFNHKVNLKPTGKDTTTPREWCSDSGTNRFITNDADDFIPGSISLKSTPVTVGGGTVMSDCTGSVLIRSHNYGHLIQCDNVLLLANCPQKLIPVSSFTKKGCRAVYDATSVLLTSPDGRPLLNGHEHQGLFFFNATTVTASHDHHPGKHRGKPKPRPNSTFFGLPVGKHITASSRDFSQKLMETHCAMGHMRFDTIRKYLGLKKGDNPECPACTIAMSRQDSKNKNDYKKSTRSCHRMWMDLGFTRNNSYTFQLYLDDYSSFTYLDILKTKDEALPRWIDLKRKLENDIGYPNKFAIITTDSEPLYFTPAWKRHCTDEGLEHEFSSRHRHDMLGRIERQMQTIGGCFRAMMIHGNNPERDIPDALRFANVVRNNSPTSANGGWSPREKKAGMRLPPDKNLMRGPFGCLVFAHVYSEERLKHGDRGVPCTFLGYDQDNNTFLVREIISGRRYYTADVTFHPSILPNRLPPSHDFTHLAPAVTQPSEIIEPSIPSGNDVPSLVSGREGRIRQPSAQALRNIPDSDQAPQDPDNICLHNFGPDPDTMSQARQMYDADDWIKAELSEKNSLKHHGVYTVVPRSNTNGKRVFKARPVYKRKINPPDEFNPEGSLDKHKVRMTIAAFTKMLKQGIDYEEKHANTVRWSAQLLLIAIAVKFDYDIVLIDIATFFLYGELEDELYMEIPDGWGEDGKDGPEYIWKLNKTLYGAPQAPHRAQVTLNKNLTERKEFKSTAADDCVYTSTNNHTGYVAAGTHVDDITAVGEKKGVDKLIKTLKRKFEITVKTNPSHITGVQIQRDRKKKWLKLHQEAYTVGILEKYNMLDARTTDTPMDPGTAKALMLLPDDAHTPETIKAYQVLMGLLMWLHKTRPDLSFTINLGARFLRCASQKHLDLMMGRPLRYLNGTRKFGIVFHPGSSAWELSGSSDSDWAGDLRTGRSTSGTTIKIGDFGTLHCASKLERKISTSTGQAETYALLSWCKEVVWLRQLTRELGFPMLSPTVGRVDNDGVVRQAVKLVNHTTAKHYRIAQAYIRQLCSFLVTKIVGEDTASNESDMFTKPLVAGPFTKHRHTVMGPQDPPA